MAKVTFLDSGDSSPKNLLSRLAHMIQGLVKSGQRVAVVVRDEDAAKNWDKLLWTFSPESFIPHSVSRDVWPDDEPVLIRAGSAPLAKPGHSCLDLTALAPSELSEWEHIFEVVNRLDEESVKASRTLWASWKRLGAELIYKKTW
jgi:DNA polymerase III subunit chi